MVDISTLSKKILSIVGQLHELRPPGVMPTETALGKVLEDLFWSSVDRYEGNPLRARVFFAPRAALTGSDGIIQLASRYPFPRTRSVSALQHTQPTEDCWRSKTSTASISKESSAAFRSLEGVRPLWLCVECRGPGSLRVSIGSQPILEFTRGEVKQLGGMSFDRTAAEGLLMHAGLFAAEPAALAWHVSSALLDIGQGIEQHGTGGALWILPAGASMDGDLENLGKRVEMRSAWWEPFREMWEMRTSVIRLLNPGCDKGHDYLKQAAQQWDLLRREALTRSVSSLAKVDGAIVINGSPDVLAFGVICNEFSCPATEVLRATEPSRLMIGEVAKASEFGGSRHQSAIDFCSSCSPAGAVVASHDGGLTVFASTNRGRVIGSRVSLIGSDADVQKN